MALHIPRRKGIIAKAKKKKRILSNSSGVPALDCSASPVGFILLAAMP